MSSGPFTDDERQAIDLYCAGDATFFVAYRQSCLETMASDLATGAQAYETGDLVQLRRIVHSLKSVLKSIGQSALAELAAHAERVIVSEQGDAAARAWEDLYGRLSGLVVAGSDGA